MMKCLVKDSVTEVDEPVLEEPVLAAAANDDSDGVRLNEYFRFLVYCLLLVIPIYAIVVSAIQQNWIMMVIDLVFIPIGFVHGVLLLSGIVGG